METDMTDAKTITEIVTQVSDAAKTYGGYPYSTGYLHSTLIGIILSYVPVASRKEVMVDLQDSLNYLETVNKKEA
jgi:hypothetical protein